MSSSPPPPPSSLSPSQSWGGWGYDGVQVLTLVIYLPLGAVAAWRLAVHARATRQCSRLVQFHAFLTTFYLATVLHAVLKILMTVEPLDSPFCDSTAFFLGTCAHCLFFTSLLLMILHILEHMYQTLVHRNLVTSMVVVVAVWVFMSLPYFYAVATSLYFLICPDALTDGNPIYDSTILIICGYAALLGAAYCVTALLIFRRAHYLENNVLFFHMSKKPLYLFLLVMVTCFASFILQFVMLLYRPVTHKFLPQYLFEVLAYWLPENASAVLLLIVARKPLLPGYKPTATKATLNVQF
eukprot:TRINITY_DN959_c0_g2_i6.p1 TRINITY_DN959_c0_g2~~TRINITY_DN959_c0_g2_i6.p1  ORF type:complete len:297 (-),score=61.98 TRINITY_DN959_c0_g2_i6:109-999(-)